MFTETLVVNVPAKYLIVAGFLCIDKQANFQLFNKFFNQLG